MGKSSGYKGVIKFNRTDTKGGINWSKGKWKATHGKWQRYCDSEREAAIVYNLKMIELGLEPVNILKKR